MIKISAMYKWSGGTDYRNVCKWCRNCIQTHRGRKKVYKCRVYGITDGPETDWKPEHIACKKFDIQYSGTPILFQRGGAQEVKNTPKVEREVSGEQMNIFDYPEVWP